MKTIRRQPALVTIGITVSFSLVTGCSATQHQRIAAKRGNVQKEERTRAPEPTSSAPSLAGVWESLDPKQPGHRLVLCPNRTSEFGSVGPWERAATPYRLAKKDKTWWLTFAGDEDRDKQRVAVTTTQDHLTLRSSNGSKTEFVRSSQKSPCGDSLPALSVAYQLRGYFQAGGQSEGLGGNYVSGNVPMRLDQTFSHHQGLTLIARRDSKRPWSIYAGYEVVLLNAGKQPIELEAQDARLAIVHEALDEDGKWQAIEYLPNSWCGNSYHTLTLPSATMWTFTAPIYTGTFRTKVRLRLQTPSGPIYSNEFDAPINREQLDPKAKQGHANNNIMYPYNE